MIRREPRFAAARSRCAARRRRAKERASVLAIRWGRVIRWDVAPDLPEEKGPMMIDRHRRAGMARVLRMDMGKARRRAVQGDQEDPVVRRAARGLVRQTSST